jgi:hypothetical protein|tara:strand:- start:919 stop:1239 length:321 start_codon:yes stop_codon:yes gene_type:complete
MIALFIIAVFAYMITQIKIKMNDTVLTELIKETHKYSGIHEDSYGQFYANIQMALEYMDAQFLYKAIHHLNEIPLYMSPIDPDVQGEIAELGQRIGIAFEREKKYI